MAENKGVASEPKLSQSLITDVRRGDLTRTIRRDWSELKEFYLDQQRNARLQEMGWLKRFFTMAWWLLKSLFFKLTPVRRVLVVISFLLILQAGAVIHQDGNMQFTGDSGKAGLVILLFVLMLELKDKLLAQSELATGRAVQRSLAADSRSLAGLGAKLNAILRRDGLPDSFASLVYLELQPGSGDIRLLNAGHLPPLLCREYTITEIARGSTALGLLPEAAFAEQLLDLQAGDALVAYSDGLTEVRDEAGAFFGEPRLFSFRPTLAGLPADEIGTKLLAELESFVGEAKAHDDLSVILLKRVARNKLAAEQ